MSQEKRVTPQVLDKIFDKIVKDNKAGTLLVSDGVNEKCLYFTMTGLRMISSGSRKTGKIGQFLLAMSAIDSETLEEGLSKQEIQKTQKKKKTKVQLIGEILEDTQKVAHQEIIAAVRKQAENEIIDLYYWPEGVYEFNEGAAPAKFYDERFDSIVLNVKLKDFITGIRQKISEFRKASHNVKNVWNVFEMTNQGRERLNSGILKEHKQEGLLQKIDGDKNLAQLSYGGVPNFFELAKICSELMAEGLINMIPKPAAGPVDFGMTLKTKAPSEIEEDLEDLEAAIDRAINAVLVHRRMAQSNEAINKPNDAAKHYRQVGEIQFKEEKFDDSLSAFENAKRLDPTDFGSQQKMMKIFEYKKLDDKLIEMGLELGKRFLENGLFNKAKQIFQNLNTKKPDNLEVKERLLDSYVGLGDKESAKKEMEELGQVLKKEGKQDEYVQLLQKMVDFNMADHNIRKALNSALGRQLMWMVTIIVSGVGTVILTLLAFYFFTQYNSVAEWNGVVSKVQDFKNEYRYGDALKAIEDWAKKYPASSAITASNTLAEEIRVLRKTSVHNELQYSKSIAETESDPYVRKKEYEKLLKHPVFKETSKDPKILFEKKNFEKTSQELTRYILRFQKLKRQAKETRETVPQESFDIYQRLLKNYLDFPETKNFLVPFRIESNPPGATISLLSQNKELGTTTGPGEKPLIVDLSLSLSGSIYLQAKLPGYESTPRAINIDSPHVIEILFSKKPNWSFAANGKINSPVAEDNGTLYFSASDCFVYAVNGTNGSLIWKAPLGPAGESILAPLVYEHFLIVGTLGGNLFCFNRNSGEVLAKHYLGYPQQYQYIPTGKGLIAVRGNEIIRFPLWDNPKQKYEVLRTEKEDISCHPTSLEDIFFFFSGERLLLFEKEDLAILKTKKPLPGTMLGFPIIEKYSDKLMNFYFFMNNNRNYLYKYGYFFTTDKLKFRWSWPNEPKGKKLFIGDVLTKPIIPTKEDLSHLFIFGATDQNVFAINKKSSKSPGFAWHIHLGGKVIGSLSQSEDGRYLYVPCEDKNVYVIEMFSNKAKIIKTFPIPAAIYSNVVLVQNQMIVPGENGVLYSYNREHH